MTLMVTALRMFRSTSPTDDALVAECRAIMARHARSFDRAASFLPPTTRDRVAVLYAFCRIVDDTVDEAPDRARALAGVEALRRELGWATTEVRPPGSAVRPVVTAFARLVSGSSAAVRAAHALCEGVASDVDAVLVADDRELLRYCYRVAGAVGVLMCPTLGVHDPRALPFAIDLGIAMQLTNICRDVAEDAARGRVYLPAARLSRAGTSSEALVRGDADPAAVAAVVCDLLALADRYYASADLGMRYIPFVGRQAILVARYLYWGIGAALARSGGDALRGRTVVPPAHKLVLIGRALSRNLTLVERRGGAHPEHDRELHRHLHDFPGVDTRAASTTSDG